MTTPDTLAELIAKYRKCGSDPDIQIQARNQYAEMADELEAALDALAEKWENERAHTYASENADLYRGFENGRKACAAELRGRGAKV